MARDESNEPIVSVMFRRWKDEQKEPIAVFPYLPADEEGRTVTSYMHVGQHGGAHLQVLITATKAANTSEADVLELYKELQARGYRMKVIKRVQR